MKLPEQKKTETIVDKDGNVVAEVDYIDDLQFRIKLLEDGYQGGYYYINEHGGMSEIDKLGCCRTYYPFDMVTTLLSKIIHLQCDVRKKDFKKEQKENDNTGND